LKGGRSVRRRESPSGRSNHRGKRSEKGERKSDSSDAKKEKKRDTFFTGPVNSTLTPSLRRSALKSTEKGGGENGRKKDGHSGEKPRFGLVEA